MYRKNVTGQYLYFALVNATTGAALTGATVTGKRSIDGAAQGSVTGTISEDAGGQYHLALSQADINGNNIGFLFTATNAIPVSICVVTTAADPTDAAAFGLSRIDAAVSSRMATFTLPTNFSSLVIDANGRIDLSKVLGSTINALISGRVDANAQVVGDKTGYSLTQAFPTNFSTLSIDSSGRVTLVPTQIVIKKNTALAAFTILMTDATTHAPKTGLTVTATRKIDGGSFAACANSVAEVASGVYVIDLAAADLNGTVVTFRFTATGADDLVFTVLTQP